MKTMTLAFVLAAALTGCSKDKPKAKTTPVSPSDTPAAKTDAPKVEPVISADQPVSGSLAVSSDIVAACGLKVTTPSGAAPTFDYDKEDLGPDDRAVLDQIAQCLTAGALKGKSVALVGRADPRGTEEYNLGLGSRRAASVSAYLKRLGVADPQLGVTTRGAIDAAGTDEAGWKHDRRVDIQLAAPTN